MSSPTAFDDTQFDLDLSDHLDQFPDPVVPSDHDRGAGDLAADVVLGVALVRDPWGMPAADGGDQVLDAPALTVTEAATEDVAVTDADPAPAVAVAEPVVTTAAAAEPAAATTVEDVPVPWVPAEGGTATYPAAVARAVDPPTSVHSVFAVTPPQGTPVVVLPPLPPAPPSRGASSRAARRRRRVVAVLGAVLAAGLVAGGAGLAIATNDDGEGDVFEAASPGDTVALPPAGAQADKPDDDEVVPVVPAAPDAPDAADEVPAAGDAADLERAADAVTAFLAVRGTDDERAVSSQGGRGELDAAIAAIGRAVPQGDPACSVGAAAGTFGCVLDTDQGPITFTVGPDADDPQTSGFEVIGATA
ncbi:MAG: hypothetical protein JNK12_03945 [Acidimicrobiales bacterium]|nr:hypothetical protein [Acidimicrobiales bacterium]